MNGSQQRDDSPLITALLVLRRRWQVVLLCVVSVPAVTLMLSLNADKTYKATASLLFRQTDFAQSVLGTDLIQTYKDPKRQGDTNLQLVSLSAIARITARQMPGYTPADVRDSVTVNSSGQADVVNINASAKKADDAARMANEYAIQFIAFRRRADQSQIAKGVTLVRRQLATLSPSERGGTLEESLRQQAQKLQLLSALQTGDAELVQSATPPAVASSPRIKLNTALGGIAGVLLGVALAMLFARLDRRVRSTQQVEAILELPVLATVHESRDLVKASGDAGVLESQRLEPFRTLRTNLRYFNVDRDIRSVLITSASSGDGKSTVAWNLGVVAAAAGARVLLMETDLRNPSFERFSGSRPVAGLSQLLAGYMSLEDVKVPIHVSGPAVPDASAKTMDVLPAGALPPNPAELLDSNRMRELLSTVEQEYDLVILDTPPVSVVADVVPLLRRVSGAVLVTRLGRNTTDQLAELRQQFENLGAHTLGVVINGLTDRSTHYYGYGAYRAPSSYDATTQGEPVQVD